jgi:hypothetical protein
MLRYINYPLMLSVIMASVIMLHVVMLSVVMMNVVAPQRALGCQYPFLQSCRPPPPPKWPVPRRLNDGYVFVGTR